MTGLAFRNWMTRARGLGKEDDPQDVSYHDHPKFTRLLERLQCNFLVGLGWGYMYAVRGRWACYPFCYLNLHGQLHGLSCPQRGGLSPTEFCEYVIKVTVYNMSTLTFLQNCTIAYIFQDHWYHRGRVLGTKTAFVVLMLVCAMTCFGF